MKDKLFQKYDEIFQKYSNIYFGNNLIKRGFVFQYDNDEQNADLLFMGINPSYTIKNEENNYLRDAYSRNADINYFKAFNAINEKLLESKVGYNGIYTHIDLLVFRETNQKFINSVMNTPNGCDFLMEQLEIAKQRLIYIRPKIVIVCNSKAREFLGKDKSIKKNGKINGVWMGLEFKFDDEQGAHKVTNIPELKNTYFLFSSMLSGQRALDTGSRERMIWQIKRILKQY